MFCLNYCMDIECEFLCGESYENFLKAALLQSDKFSLSIFWLRKEDMECNIKKQALLDEGYSEEWVDNLQNDSIAKMKEFKRIFESEELPFFRKLEPFLVEGQKISEKVSTYYFHSDIAVLPYLLEPKGINGWGFPQYPDDLAFITENTAWFISESHEQSAMVHIRDKQDYDFWRNIGIVFRKEFGMEEYPFRGMPIAEDR